MVAARLPGAQKMRVRTMPEISIIVPVYRAEKYLNACVDSILNQTYSDFELVLIEDGSPDQSGAICDEYAQKDDRVRVIHQPNQGQAAASNHACPYYHLKLILPPTAKAAGGRYHRMYALDNLRLTGYDMTMEKRYVKIFIAVQVLLYAAFLWLDMSGAGGSRWIKYASIVLCLGFSAFLSARGGEKLVTAAMGFTLAADTFLLLLGTAYAAGVALFCAVQALYFVRIYRANGRRAALPARLALFLDFPLLWCITQLQ